MQLIECIYIHYILRIQQQINNSLNSIEINRNSELNNNNNNPMENFLNRFNFLLGISRLRRGINDINENIIFPINSNNINNDENI